jgi:hypothetical protein
MKRTIVLLLFAIPIFSCKKDNPDPEPQIPDRIEVLNITITNYPQTNDNGQGWDVFNPADIYPVLSFGNTILADLRSQYIQDALTGTFTWQLNGVDLNNPKGTYTISLYDFDDISEDDFMGGISFTPWEEGNGTPTKMTISCNGCKTSWELELDYHF